MLQNDVEELIEDGIDQAIFNKFLSSDTLNENNERATNFSKIIWELDDARRRTES